MRPQKQSKDALQKAAGVIKDFYAKNRALFFLICAGIVIAGCAAVYFSVELTSTVQFCSSCHEMKPAYDSWKSSTHCNVKPGKKQATCRDCHLPPWNHPIKLLWEKAFHGVKDITRHFTDAAEFDEPGYYFNMKAKAWKTVDNSSCFKCHTDIFVKKYDGYENIHVSIKNNPNASCAKCHEGLVHKNYLPQESK
jgi:nitrate/TMAO reductase-like tetraheme cytochrome c subunit